MKTTARNARIRIVCGDQLIAAFRNEKGLRAHLAVATIPAGFVIEHLDCGVWTRRQEEH